MTHLRKLDWAMVASLLPLFLWSLLTLKGVGSADDYFFWRQVLWIAIGGATLLFVSSIDWRLFSNSGVVVVFYVVVVVMLTLLFLGGERVKGAVSWFHFHIASFQPAEVAKLVLILLLAKYFSQRHIDIARIRHIIASGVYAGIPTALIFFQPDLGSALVVFAIWFGITVVSGIRLRHLTLLAVGGVAAALVGWSFLLAPYQKARITAFLNPALDPQGASYNAIQSMVAVGSGEFLGKGVGFGSQSRLRFLPEAHTDFMFAAFAEEWGFLGVTLLFIALGVFIGRVLFLGLRSSQNFVKLYALGFASMVMVQSAIHAGMNMGLLPITGITFPFMSYGGSSLLVLCVGVGILQSMYVRRDPAASLLPGNTGDAIV